MSLIIEQMSNDSTVNLITHVLHPVCLIKDKLHDAAVVCISKEHFSDPRFMRDIEYSGRLYSCQMTVYLIF